jgi:hypothetical protein
LIIPLSKCGVHRFTFQYEIAEGGCVGGEIDWGTGMTIHDGENNHQNKNKNDNGNESENEDRNKDNNKNGEMNSHKNEKSNENNLIKEEEQGGGVRMAVAIRKAGMLCGVCIAPHTDVKLLEKLLNVQYCTDTGNVRYTPSVHTENITSDLPSSPSPPISTSSSTSTSSISSSSSFEMFWTPLIDYVDVLAVAPGIGGQEFNHTVLEKVILSYLSLSNSHLPLLRSQLNARIIFS